MLSVKTILLSLLISNLFVLVILFLNSKNDIEESLLDEDSQFMDIFDDDSILDSTTAYDSDNSDVIDQVIQDLTDSDNNDVDDMGKSSPTQGHPIDDPYGLQKEMQMTTEFLETAGKIINQVRKFRNALRSVNPFNLMEVYEPVEVKYFNAAPYGHPLYSYPNMGLINDASYCEFVDLYNLYHPENVYESMNFFTDYTPDGLVRSQVMDRIGVDTMPQVHKNMNRSTFYSKVFPLNYTTTLFFTKKVTFHYFHEIGKHFLSVQPYSRPWYPDKNRLECRKCEVSIGNPAYDNTIIVNMPDATMTNPNVLTKICSSQKHSALMVLPRITSIKLTLDKEECRQFFRELSSEEYKTAKKKNIFYFIEKVSYGAHRSSGVVLFDNLQEAEIKKTFDSGRKCGEAFSQSIVMQKYISDPLLFDGHKFDFRVYLLIASTNPLIAFYHDGFLRLSLYYYKKDSDEKGVHLTNTHVSKDVLKKGPEGAKFGDMNETELRNYQMRSMTELQGYLLNTGRVSDKNWLDNYLRPQLQRAYIHLIRMSEGHFLKNSGVFELFGVDFLLDENLNLWFIECNASPQLMGTNEEKTNEMTTMLANMFEVQYAYLRSRMKRIQAFMAKIHSMILSGSDLDYRDLKKEFQELNKNKLEPELNLRQDMSWVKIMDKNYEGEKAYMNLIEPDCIDD